MTRQLAIDIAERAAATAVQAFISALLVGPALDLSVPTVKAAGLAALAAVLSILKGVAASRLGDPTSAAALPSPATGD
jgi:hypothetical protein